MVAMAITTVNRVDTVKRSKDEYGIGLSRAIVKVDEIASNATILAIRGTAPGNYPIKGKVALEFANHFKSIRSIVAVCTAIITLDQLCGTVDITYDKIK